MPPFSRNELLRSCDDPQNKCDTYACQCIHDQGCCLFVLFVKKLTTICHTHSLVGTSSHPMTSNTLKFRRFPISLRIASFHEFPASGVFQFFDLAQSSTVTGSASYARFRESDLQRNILKSQGAPWMGASSCLPKYQIFEFWISQRSFCFRTD